MATLKQIKLGAFPAGEIPHPLRHQFLTFDRQVINIIGWTVLGFFVEGPENFQAPAALPLITNGAQGEITYTWVEGDMGVVGAYQGILWIENPTATIRLGSDLYVWDVADAPGPTPPEIP